jgi:hypothetical protein
VVVCLASQGKTNFVKKNEKNVKKSATKFQIPLTHGFEKMAETDKKLIFQKIGRKNLPESENEDFKFFIKRRDPRKKASLTDYD